MMRKLRLIVLFAFLSLIISNPAFCVEPWYEGVVVMKNHEVIQGSLNVNEQYDILQVKVAGQIRSIPAWQIQKFSIHDEGLEAVRLFITIPSKSKRGVLHEFYEIIIRGEVMLLAREKIYKNTTTFMSRLIPGTVNEFVNNKDFFFFDGKNLVRMEKFRKVILPAFKRQFEEEINDYIRMERVNLNHPKDQIRVMKYFNELHDDEASMARID